MTEAEWLSATDPKPMIEFVGRTTTERKRLLFCCACCFHIRRALVMPASIAAVEGTERLADGQLAYDERARLLVRASEVVGQFQGYQKYAASAAQLSLIHAEGWEGDGLIRRPWIVAQEASDATEYFQTQEMAFQCATVHDIFGNPFRPVALDPSWLTSTVVALAEGIYAERAFDRLPILADALMDAGCDNDDVLTHCRGDGQHVRGCWVVDRLTGRA